MVDSPIRPSTTPRTVRAGGSAGEDPDGHRGAVGAQHADAGVGVGHVDAGARERRIDVLAAVVEQRLGVLGPDVAALPVQVQRERLRSEEHTSEIQSLMRISYAVFCLK